MMQPTFKPPPVPYANEVICPLNPVPPGWDSLPVEQQPLVEWTIRYFAKIPDFLECAQVLRHSDKSVSLSIFPYQNYEVELDLLRGATCDSHLGPHILHIECNTRSKSVLKPSIVGAIVVYLRTAEYNNAHPGSVSRRSMSIQQYQQPTARTMSLPALDAAMVSAFRHRVPDATEAERREINAIGNALITLQGVSFQAAAQVFLRLDAQGYELRTFGYRYPITEDHLALVATLPGVQRVFVNFHLKRNDCTGALVVVCRLSPRKRGHDSGSGQQQITPSTAAAVSNSGGSSGLVDAGYDDDDDEDEDDQISSHHRTKRVAFVLADNLQPKPRSPAAAAAAASSANLVLGSNDPLNELLSISTSSSSAGTNNNNNTKDSSERSLWSLLNFKFFGS